MTSTGGAPGRPTYAQAAWSWTEHLQAGGTQSWADWVATGAGADVAVPPAWTPPGAAQLELLRRLWLEGRGDEPTRSLLADVVLRRSGPGRGLPQQPLSWPAGPERRFGPPPVDPAQVPDEELLRVGVGTLADLLLADLLAGTPSPDAPQRPLFTRTPPFVLAGAPVTTSVVRRDLAAAGHVEGGRAPQVLLFAEPLDVALAQVWTARVQRGAAVRWPGFVDRWAHRHSLPPAVDVAGLARSWSDRVGHDRVHVLVDPGRADAATRSAAEVLRVPYDRRGAPAGRPRVWPLSAAATDVARRVNAVLHVRVADDRRTVAARALSTLLAGCDDRSPADGLTVPARFGGWVEDTAARQAEQVDAGGYPVHGEPARLVPTSGALPGRPDVADAVRIMARACLEQAARNHSARKAEER